MYGYGFHRQKPIDDYILAFFCHELMLGIGVDSYSHQIVEVFNKDVKKEKVMNRLGICIVRFTGHQVLKDTDNVVRAIEWYIVNFEEHTPRPTSVGSVQRLSIGELEVNPYFIESYKLMTG